MEVPRLRYSVSGGDLNFFQPIRLYAGYKCFLELLVATGTHAPFVLRLRSNTGPCFEDLAQATARLPPVKFVQFLATSADIQCYPVDNVD